MAQSWSLEELHQKLAQFEHELTKAGLHPSSVRTYVDRSAIFLRWIGGDYRPTGPRR